ncbi:MAG: DUF1614 domain-containing protein [Candidatus Binatus sp.]
MYPPVTGATLGIFGLLLVVLFAFVEVGVIRVTYQRLGISPRIVTLLLFAMILGSYLNLPIATISAPRILENRIVYFWGMPYVVPGLVYPGRTQLAINVGGAVIPIGVCVYLLGRFKAYATSMLATLIVSIVVYWNSRVVPGVGIAVPTIIPGILAAATAYILDSRRSPAVAYVAGTLGCLLGADIMNLPLVAQMQAPVASIGGAGTFDGVFVSGLIAAILA